MDRVYDIYAMGVCASILAIGIGIFIYLDRKANRAHEDWLNDYDGQRPKQFWDNL